MSRLNRIVAVVAAAFFLTACQTLPDGPLRLKDALEADLAVTLPMRVNDKGLFVLQGIEINGASLNFVIDTGATQSAIFEGSLSEAGLKDSSQEERMVHGMIDSQSRRVLTLSEMKLGPLEYNQKPIIVLDNPRVTIGEAERYDGLIGMDILASYNLIISPSTQELKLIPKEKEISVPSYWSRIELTPNPFQADNRDLHFLQLRIAGRRTVALLDTGSQLSIINWEAASFSQVKSIRRRLERDWQMQGAVGVFKPRTRIKLEHFRGGQKFWVDKNFIIMDFESLDVLGIGEKPFIIAGVNLFSDETVFIDFERNFLAIDSSIPEDDPYWEEEHQLRLDGLP